jgi:hypothetical protein
VGVPAAMKVDGDANNDQAVDGDDLAVWVADFGLPENAIATASAAASTSSAEPIPTLSALQSAELHDLAIAAEWAGYILEDRSHFTRAVVDERIIFDQSSRSLWQGLNAPINCSTIAQPGRDGRRLDHSREDGLSVRHFGDNQFSLDVHDALFARRSCPYLLRMAILFTWDV